eukprot:1073708-Prorocentrum_minimum.AAC.1
MAGDRFVGDGTSVGAGCSASKQGTRYRPLSLSLTALVRRTAGYSASGHTEGVSSFQPNTCLADGQICFQPESGTNLAFEH